MDSKTVFQAIEANSTSRVSSHLHNLSKSIQRYQIVPHVTKIFQNFWHSHNNNDNNNNNNNNNNLLRMIEIWQECTSFQTTNQRLADQVRTIIKKGWFSDPEIQEIHQKINNEQDSNIISNIPSIDKQK